MQVLAVSKPLDSDDLAVLVRDSQREAAIDTPPIEQNGTGATLPVVAALLGTGKSEMFAQRIQERCPRIDGEPVYCPIHSKGNLNIHIFVCLLCYIASGSLEPTAASP